MGSKHRFDAYDLLTEKVARLMEDIAREGDSDREEFPSLKRTPRGADSWKGFVHDAERVVRVVKS